jgi:L-idonate 5-dehydrogenase
MLALGMREVGKPEILEVADAPPPRDGEVRVAMEMVALSVAEMRACRGDRFRHFRQTIDPASPFVFGFAGVGRIESSGDPSIAAAQRVVLSGLDACGSCTYCRLGLDNHCVALKLSGIDVDSPGFARGLVHAAGAPRVPLPEDFGLPRACVVSEVATAIHALQQARLVRGEAFGVVGAGRHGRQIIRVAKRWGAHPIVAIDPAPVRARAGTKPPVRTSRSCRRADRSAAGCRRPCEFRGSLAWPVLRSRRDREAVSSCWERRAVSM